MVSPPQNSVAMSLLIVTASLHYCSAPLLRNNSINDRLDHPSTNVIDRDFNNFSFLFHFFILNVFRMTAKVTFRNEKLAREVLIKNGEAIRIEKRQEVGEKIKKAGPNDPTELLTLGERAKEFLSD